MCCCECLSDICLIILSVLFPPLPVWIRRGICSCDSLINILLCFLGYFPGLIHSWYIIAKYPPYVLETKNYYIYQGLQHPDLENQISPRHNHHHNHNHHCHTTTNHFHPTNDEPRLINQQPNAVETPHISYGAINDNPSSSNDPIPAPPAYTEMDNGKSV